MPDARSRTVREALSEATALLRSAGLHDGAAQARWLLAHLLGDSLARLAGRDPAGVLPDSTVERLRSLVAQRGEGVPVQHLLGRAAFRRLDLRVGPGVFIPRFETETLVELALIALTHESSRASAAQSGTPMIAVDLGSGTGAIALSLASELPERGVRAEVIAVERSAEAREWLKRNAMRRAASGDRPIRIVGADLGDPALLRDGGLLFDLVGQVALVVSNPPYVPTGTSVAQEVRHDPAEAVFAGADGLDVIRCVIPLALELLRPGGTLLLEHDESHQDEVLELMRDVSGPAGLAFTGVTGHADLTGRARFASGTAAFAVGPASRAFGTTMPTDAD
jgi:release factor glutamine methyltransferase